MAEIIYKNYISKEVIYGYKSNIVPRPLDEVQLNEVDGNGNFEIVTVRVERVEYSITHKIDPDIYAANRDIFEERVTVWCFVRGKSNYPGL